MCHGDKTKGGEGERGREEKETERQREREREREREEFGIMDARHSNRYTCTRWSK